MMELRIWWHRRYSDTEGHTVRIPVTSVEDAIRVLDVLAMSEVEDETVYLNAGGLEVMEGTEWVDWYDDDGRNIDEIMAERDLL
jgi:hypothetical protein